MLRRIAAGSLGLNKRKTFMMKHIRVQLAFRKESRRVASKDARSLQMPGGDFRVLVFYDSWEPKMAEAVGAE